MYNPCLVTIIDYPNSNPVIRHHIVRNFGTVTIVQLDSFLQKIEFVKDKEGIMKKR